MSDISEHNSLAQFNPTAKDYVQDGLIYQLDGIENDGYGVEHKASCPWRDLISGNIYNTSNIGQFDSDHLVIPANYTTSLHYAMTDTLKTACAKGFVTVEFRGRHGFTTASERQLFAIYSLTPDVNIYGVKTTNSNKDAMYLDIGGNSIAKSTTESTPYDSEGRIIRNVNLIQNGTIGFVNEIDSDLNYTVNNCISIPNTQYIRSNFRRSPISAFIYAIRIYNRVLEKHELDFNYRIDKMRFGI